MERQNSKRLPRNFDIPFYDLNPRSYLEVFSKEVEEKLIDSGPYEEGQIKASPLMLALAVIGRAQSHLDSILNDFPKRLDPGVKDEEKTNLFLELLALYYFLTGENIRKYLKGDQFTLFVSKFHVELLDNLPKIGETLWLFGVNPLTRSKKIKEIVGKGGRAENTGLLSLNIHRAENFYIKNKLTNEEKREINKLKKFLLLHDPKTIEDYEKNLILQFLVKGFYKICKALNLALPKDLEKIIISYISHSWALLLTQKYIGRHIKPVWHDKK